MGALIDEVAVVTGASSGIGEAIVRRFADEGAAVVIAHHFHPEKAQALVEEIQKGGGRAIEVGADVRQETDVARVFSSTHAAFGRATILVNSAGVNSRGTKLADMEVAQLENVLRTDVVGPFLFCREFIRQDKGQGRSRKIINVTSIHEETPQPGAADYCAAKGALRNLTRCLALEVAEAGITVNNLAPGMTLTPMNQQAIDHPSVRKKMTSQIPLKRAAQPSEVAELALYIASRSGDYATGASFMLDGGFQLNVAQGG